MAAAKTRPTDASVDAFIDAAEAARRVEEGRRLVQLMREETGEEPVMWGPSMVGFGSYRIVSSSKPSGSGEEWFAVGFSPRRGALSLYGLKDRPEGAALLPDLGGYTEGAGCVYVKRLEQVDEAVLRQLVRIAHRRGDAEAAGA